MNPRSRYSHSFLSAVLAASLFATSPVTLGAGEIVTYEMLAPVLAQRCVVCHSGEAAAANLRLDSFDALIKGGRSGPVCSGLIIPDTNLGGRVTAR